MQTAQTDTTSAHVSFVVSNSCIRWCNCFIVGLIRKEIIVRNANELIVGRSLWLRNGIMKFDR